MSVGGYIQFKTADVDLTSMMFLVRGSVMTFSRSGASAPVWISKESMISLVSLKRNPEATSRGNSTNTDSQLKKSWTVAPANALRQTFN